ncbi:MAG TPA: porin family protein [Candidatus Deferrimicrobiaceae bacterium]
MKTMLRIAAFALLATVFPAPAANAEGNYVVAKGGFYTPDSNGLDGYGSGFAGEAAVGHEFARNLAGEVGVGYIKADKSATSGKLSAVPVTVTALAKLPLDVVELYAGAGLGVYNAKFEETGIPSSSDTAFGYHLTAGGRADLSRQLFVGAEFRYLWAKATFDRTDLKLDGYTASVDLGFRF